MKATLQKESGFFIPTNNRLFEHKEREKELAEERKIYHLCDNNV